MKLNKNFILSFVLMLSPLFASAEQSVQSLLHQGELALETDPVEVDKISYETAGKPGAPWIILIHGLGGSRHSWYNVARKLAQDFQVLIYDQRGHGDNLTEKYNYSSSTMARDLAGLMDKLNISQAHIVGHSMGGRTAIRFASSYPERTLTVTIEDMHAMGRSKLLEDRVPFAKAYPRPYKYDFDDEEETERKYMPSSVMIYHNHGLQEDLTKALVSIKAPITFFAADEKKGAVLFGKGLDHIEANKPEAKIIKFNKVGHGIHGWAPSLFIEKLREATGVNAHQEETTVAKEKKARKKRFFNLACFSKF